MKQFLWVCIGSAAGGGARHLVYQAMAKAGTTEQHLATLVVNLVGSFAIALIMAIASESNMSPAVRLALTAGVLGGFTTYSTFSFETMRYLQDGARVLALVNVVVALVGGLAACGLGWYVGKSLLS